MKNDILLRAIKGNKFSDLHIVDSHCHMGPTHNFYFPKAEIDEMVYDADLMGVEKVCVATHTAITCDYRLGNKQVAEAAEKFPDRVLALLVLNANKPDEIEHEFDLHYKNKSFVGVKLHPGFHDFSVTENNSHGIYKKVREHGGFILSHTWDGSGTCSVELCEKVIKDYPEIPFVLGHSGGTLNGIKKSITLVNKYENAYMDTSGFEYSNIWIEEIVKKADNTKRLFGSDYPFHDIRGGLSRILFADIDDDTKRLILGQNFYNMTKKLKKSYIS